MSLKQSSTVVFALSLMIAFTVTNPVISQSKSGKESKSKSSGSGKLVIGKTEGTVQVKEPGGEWKKAKEGTEISPDTKISTGYESAVYIDHANGGVTRIDELKQGATEELRKQGEEVKGHIFLKSGEADVHIKQKEFRGSFKVATPRFTAAVKGSIIVPPPGNKPQFINTVSNNKKTNVKVGKENGVEIGCKNEDPGNKNNQYTPVQPGDLTVKLGGYDNAENVFVSREEFKETIDKGMQRLANPDWSMTSKSVMSDIGVSVTSDDLDVGSEPEGITSAELQQEHSTAETSGLSRSSFTSNNSFNQQQKKQVTTDSCNNLRGH